MTDDAGLALNPLDPGIEPPWSDRLERYVLGALLDGSDDEIAAIRPLVREEIFYSTAHVMACKAALAVWATGGHVDIESLAAEMEARGVLRLFSASFDLESFLARLRDAYCFAGEKADGLEDLADRRWALDALRSVGRKIHERASRADIRLALGAIARRFEDRQSGYVVGSATRAAVDGVEGGAEFEIPVPQLGAAIGPLDNGHVVVLAGDPSVGKTALAMTIVTGLLHAGVPCGVVTVDDTARECEARIVGQVARVHPRGIVARTLADDERDRCERVAAWLESKPLRIEHVPDLSSAKVFSAISKMVAQGCAVIVVDYLQKVRILGTHKNRNYEIEDIMDGCVTSMEGGAVMLLLSQLTRASQKEKRTPTLADLRDSGAIEAKARAVMILHATGDDICRAGSIHPVRRPIDVLLCKSKLGPRGKVIATLHLERSCLWPGTEMPTWKGPWGEPAGEASTGGDGFDDGEDVPF